MTLTVCSECDGRKSHEALYCPHCGAGMALALERLWRSQVREAFVVRMPDQAQESQAFIEKRRHRRIEHRTMVSVNGEKAMLFNISRSGLKLSSPFQPQTGLVRVVLETDRQSFDLSGAVRWVSPRRSFSNLLDFGVEILDPPGDYSRFVEELAAAQ